MTNREIDVLITKHIFGVDCGPDDKDWKIQEGNSAIGGFLSIGEDVAVQIFYYSSLMDDAWEVVDWLVANAPEGVSFGMVRHEEQGVGLWLAGYFSTNMVEAHESAAMAICLVALKCKGIKYD
jgi:hypothetical protein